MPIGQAGYERMLERAWSATWEAMEMAERQSRHQHRKRLAFACRVISEVQADVERTAAVDTRHGEYVMRQFVAGREQTTHD